MCTVFDLMLAHYGVARAGLPGEWPTARRQSGLPRNSPATRPNPEDGR
ncbi:nitrate reductase subunit alpha [Mycobacterium tuberculosis]|nr:nitrate reductase subunit alpha [Mycobacterium tuberculosis]